MSRHQPRATASAPIVSTSRQNEYFVPRDGIDREVISADICRYLGNDALVRPGQYEVSPCASLLAVADCEAPPLTRHVLLTEPSDGPDGPRLLHHRLPEPDDGEKSPSPAGCRSRLLNRALALQAMIDDLRADSARWENERRAQTSRNTSGGINASNDMVGLLARHSSNSPLIAQYRLSETHQSRQHHGPSETLYSTDPYGRDASAYEQPRYPGTGAAGYTGASNSFGSQPQYGYGQNPQSPSPAAPGYGSTPQANAMMNSAYVSSQDNPYIATGANNSRFEPYGSRGTNAPAPQQAIYASAPASQSGYPAYQYPGQSQQPAGLPGMQAGDNYYRGASPTAIPATPKPPLRSTVERAREKSLF